LLVLIYTQSTALNIAIIQNEGKLYLAKVTCGLEHVSDRLHLSGCQRAKVCLLHGIGLLVDDLGQGRLLIVLLSTIDKERNLGLVVYEVERMMMAKISWRRRGNIHWTETRPLEERRAVCSCEA
jgi:hypothetical protein